MGFEMDEDILQDFIIEAGEILELLSEQLVELEKTPQDTVLLNAIFRGFHTVKGGAGFLSLTPLVETCHGAENVFDNLRNGGRSLTSEVMDAILQALDIVNEQFQCVKERTDVPDASSDLLKKLETYSQIISDEEKAQYATRVPSSNNTKHQAASDEITDEEFEQLLDEIHGKDKVKPKEDEITEKEFEALLDDLHGKGQSPQTTNPLTMDSGKSEKTQSKSGNAIEKFTITSVKQASSQEVHNKKTLGQAEQTVRVNTSTLDSIMNMIGELVLVRNRLISLGSESGNEQMIKAVSNLDVVTADLQTAVMQTRMQPIRKVFGRFPRVVRDLARSLNKEIQLEMQGEDTDLDKNLVEALADPMVHLIRNAVDHGIELPDVRKFKNKPAVGTIKLSAAQEGDNILLTIEDDGGGMNADALRAIAVERKLMDADVASRLSENEAYNLIFMPGFSTKEKVSDISGRGVGMDVVKTAITQLNGTISIDSKPNDGTTILIKVPLTLAILPTLMVGVRGKPFALPLSNVNEIMSLDQSKINTVNGQLTMLIRDKAVPLFYIQDCFYSNEEYDRNEGHVVIIQLGHQAVALVVDALIGQEEVVIKPLDEILQGTPGMAGSTISSEGQIALILDISGLLNHHINHLN